jgi:hypothetical protein
VHWKVDALFAFLPVLICCGSAKDFGCLICEFDGFLLGGATLSLKILGEISERATEVGRRRSSG